jgi:PST family polysaccharide transporter
MSVPRAARTGLGTDAAYAILAVALERAVALGIALYLPRHLGLPDYGRYAFLVSYFGFFQSLPDASLEAALIAQRGASGPAASLAGRGALVRLGVSLVGALVGLSLLALLTRDAQLVRGGAICALGFVAIAASPYRVLMRAQFRMGRYLALLGGQAMFALALLAVVVRAGGGLVAVLGAVTVAAAGGVVLGRVLGGPGARLRGDRGLARALVVAAWPLAATTLTLIGAQQLLQALVVRLHGPAEMGLLGGAQKLVEAANLLPQAVMLSVLPALAAAGASAEGEAIKTARSVAHALAVVLVPVAAAFALWAGPVLGAVLGPPLVPAADTLRILSLATLLGATGAVLTNLLVATGRQRVLLRVTAGSAVVTALLGAILVPRYGAAGTAAAVVIAMLAGQAALCLLPETGTHARSVLGAVARPLALGLLAAGVISASGSGVRVGAATLVLGYPLSLLATGTVTRADLARWISPTRDSVSGRE